MRVLFCGGTSLRGRSLRRELEKAGWVVDTADPAEFLTSVASHHYEAVVLEAGSPEEARRLTTRLRAAGNPVGVVLVCSGANTTETAVAGLDAGADAFILEPSPAELSALTRAVARRGIERRPNVLVVGDLRLDPGAHIVTRAGQPIELTTREFTLLEYLMQNVGLVMSRNAILDAVWGLDYVGASNVVDVYIGYLRRKIDKPFGTAMLTSVRGIGYKLEQPAIDTSKSPTIDLRDGSRTIGA